MTLWLVIPLAVGGATACILFWRLIRRAPRLIVGERGIWPRGQGWGWIPWDEIEGAYRPTVDEVDTLRVRLRVTRRLARVLRERGRARERQPLDERLEIRLDLRDSGVSPVELMQKILAHQAAQRPPF